MDKTTKWILELTDKVTGPLQRIARQASAAHDHVFKLSNQIATLQTRSARLTSSLKSIGIGVAAFTALSYGSLQFQQAMAMTNTMAGKSSQELAGLTKQVREVASAVPMARDALADGLFNVISAGIPEDNWISFLEASSKSAIGGNSQLGTVIDATAGIVKNYKLSWEDATKIQDQFQATVKQGQIPGLEALASALPRVAGQADALGVSTEELMSSFATFTAVTGPTTSEVSTQMQALFNALMKPSAQATQVADEMGISWNSGAIKAAGGLNKFIQSVAPKIDAYATIAGKTKEEVIGSLTGSAEAMKPVLALMNGLGASFEDNSKIIAGSAGSVSAAYDNMTGTTLNRLQVLRNDFGNTMDRLVEVALPFAEAVMKVLGVLMAFSGWFMDTFPVFSKFSLAFVFAGVILTTFGLIIGIVVTKLQLYRAQLLLTAATQNGLVGAIARTIVGFGAQAVTLLQNIALFLIMSAQAIAGYVLGVGAATVAQWQLNVAMNANPIGLVVIGIMAVIGALVLLYKYWDQIISFVIKAGILLLKWNPFTWVFSLAYELFPEVRAWVDNIFDSIMKYIEKVWGFIKGIVEKVKGWFSSTVDVDVKTNGPDIPDPKTNPEFPGMEDYSMPDLSGGNGTQNGSGTPTASGVGSGGKIITMNLDIKNAFNVSAGTNIEEIADQITARLVGRLRDGIVQLG